MFMHATLVRVQLVIVHKRAAMITHQPWVVHTTTYVTLCSFWDPDSNFALL
jgi:hypothetical protein